jgi:hypothetical protein
MKPWKRRFQRVMHPRIHRQLACVPRPSRRRNDKQSWPAPHAPVISCGTPNIIAPIFYRRQQALFR